MSSLPQHLAIIPDGNRRWAKAHGFQVFKGHEQGAETTELIFDKIFERSIQYLTFWGASLSNITNRPKQEVSVLLALFERYFIKLFSDERLEKQQVRVRVFGEWEQYFPKALCRVIAKIMEHTKHFSQHHLTFLLAYTGFAEMTQAVQAIVEESKALPNLSVTAQTIKQHLFTRDLPPVDLVIRTGGEPHWSAGFMMWDVADALLYFTETLWPDFAEADLQKALDFYAATERRLGK